MITAKVFQSGNSQAIRIPSEYQTTEKEFYIRKYGEAYYLSPKNDPWNLLRYTLGKAKSLDFERDQPSMSQVPRRENF